MDRLPFTQVHPIWVLKEAKGMKPSPAKEKQGTSLGLDLTDAIGRRAGEWQAAFFSP